MKIATLGPEGTFSHEAVLKYDKDAEIIFKHTIWDVFDSVKKKEVDRGIVPIENSVSGSVGFTMDALMEFDIQVCAEIVIPVNHHLVARGKIAEIKYIYAHPQAYAQSEKYIRTNLPGAEMIPVTSNTKAAELLSKKRKKDYAAIVPQFAIQHHKLPCLAENIQDSKFNVTRFFLLCNGEISAATSKDRTSILISPHKDVPGLLYKMLGQFARRKINLSKLESRPSKAKLGSYVFYIDLEGHQSDPMVGKAFKAIKKNFVLKILGSYPREY